MRLFWIVPCALVACASHHRKTRAFVAPTECGQGPYDIHLKAHGHAGEEGVEIIACTPRRLAGHVAFQVGTYEMVNQPFGDGADNQRCVGGAPTVITSPADAGASTTTTAGAPADAPANAPTLIERPYTGNEPGFTDDLCEPLGLRAQTILGTTLLVRGRDGSILPPGGVLHVRLWSDVPNDLSGVVFMVRHVTSKKSPAEVEKEWNERDPDDAQVVDRAPPSRHGPPPAPLVEEVPARPRPTATWIPGYWSWTGSAWGWIAGFWRDERIALPAPRIEVPGAAPSQGAIWIGGAWTLRAGRYVWISGRWRAR